MALSNSQLEVIDQIYANRRLDNQIVMNERLAEVEEAIPEIAKINSDIATLASDAMRSSLSGNSVDVDSIKKEIQSLGEKKKALLLSGGFAADYLDEIYSCEKCHDTGFVDGKSCECRDKEIIKYLYSRSELKNILERENFSTFNYDLFSQSLVDENLGVDARTNMKNVAEYCQYFINHFDTEFDNLLFYGKAGTGKTFLINCIAKELMDTFHSVLYLSASQFFNLTADNVLNKDSSSVYKNVDLDDLKNCDLLIIDDLGTEFTTAFSETYLFEVLNERLIHQKSTIISTNLTLEEMQKRYDDRVFSRAMGYYSTFKIFGDDIRKLKKFSGGEN